LIPLTPELAARMLTIYERRLLDDPGKVYAQSLLDEALQRPVVPGYVRTQHEQSIHARRRDTKWLQ
jgi:hypothetical protein